MVALITSYKNIRIVSGGAYLGPLVIFLSVDDFLILLKLFVSMINSLLSLIYLLGIMHLSNLDMFYSLANSRFQTPLLYIFTLVTYYNRWFI